ncbi:hypothetical protein SUGI_0680190 [Cryptomeria japonica]|nr:hypothetical protein SUGI_0680190 [Cryptomeria japonica]
MIAHKGGHCKYKTRNRRTSTFFANLVQLGGQVAVLSGSQGTPFSKTNMGSGNFAEERNKKAGYIGNIELFTTNGVLISDMPRSYISAKKDCYNVKGYFIKDHPWGYCIYYGGPGGYVSQCKY